MSKLKFKLKATHKETKKVYHFKLKDVVSVGWPEERKAAFVTGKGEMIFGYELDDYDIEVLFYKEGFEKEGGYYSF